MALSFRNRLAVFLMLTLVLVQGATAVIAYEVTRRVLIAQSQDKLTADIALFTRQLNALSTRVSESVHVLSLDYALRQAVALQNEQTVLSTLRNHGRRVGASSMLLIGMDGVIKADTGDDAAVGRPFPAPDLLDHSVADGRARRIIVTAGKAYWIVLVPVLAPLPIGYIAANIPLDDAMVDQLRRLSALPAEVVLVTEPAAGDWHVLAKSLESPDILAQLLPGGVPPALDQPRLVQSGARQDIVLATRLPDRQADDIVAVVGLSLDEALRPYQPVILAGSGLLAIGLVVALFGTSLIARSVSRPIEALASVARRIAGGDYTPPETLSQPSEIGQLSGALGNMAVAIGEREAQIRFQATHDVITGLPNRLSLTERMDRHFRDQPVRPAALLLVGVPRLQEVVNTLGHDFRDRLMRHVGQRLQQASPGDHQVTRVADGAFALWLEDDRPPIALAHRLMQAVGQDFHEGDITVDVLTAIGIALAPQHGSDSGRLLQRADTALHQAMVKLDDRVVVYDPEQDPHRSDRLSLMSDLRQGLDQGVVRLFCQPKIDLASNCLAGAEGLVRWTDPVRGFVPPETFIQLAEETGNIRRLTQWALETGIAQAADWHRRGLRLKISVNLSVRDLSDQTLPQRVMQLLRQHQLPPASLMLEITESAIMSEPDKAIAVLRQLADQGIDLSIDDFGVGQSSFAYLRRLPVREIKIDKSFVLKLASSPDDATIVRSIVDLGHTLGYQVTAEGVEDQACFDFLREIGCDYAQGFFIAKALSPEAFDQFVTSARWPTQLLRAAT